MMVSARRMRFVPSEELAEPNIAVDGAPHAQTVLTVALAQEKHRRCPDIIGVEGGTPWT